jgi:hypothetical protein
LCGTSQLPIALDAITVKNLALLMVVRSQSRQTTHPGSMLAIASPWLITARRIVHPDHAARHPEIVRFAYRICGYAPVTA